MILLFHPLLQLLVKPHGEPAAEEGVDGYDTEGEGDVIANHKLHYKCREEVQQHIDEAGKKLVFLVYKSILPYSQEGIE